MRSSSFLCNPFGSVGQASRQPRECLSEIQVVEANGQQRPITSVGFEGKLCRLGQFFE